MRKRCACGAIDEGRLCSTCGNSLEDAPDVEAYDELVRGAKALVAATKRYFVTLLAATVSLPRLMTTRDRSRYLDPLWFLLCSIAGTQLAFELAMPKVHGGGGYLYPERVERIIKRLPHLPLEVPLLTGIAFCLLTSLACGAFRLLGDRTRLRSYARLFGYILGGPMALTVVSAAALALFGVRHHAGIWLFLIVDLALVVVPPVLVTWALRKFLKRSVLASALVTVIAWSAFVALPTIVGRALAIETEVVDASMTPLLLPGDGVRIARLYYLDRDPKVGDLVAARTIIGSNDELFIGRIAGLPGQRVQASGNEIIIAERRYTVASDCSSHPSHDDRELDVDEFFVLPDKPCAGNGGNAGRFLARSSLVGLVYARFTPLERAGPLSEAAR